MNISLKVLLLFSIALSMGCALPTLAFDLSSAAELIPDFASSSTDTLTALIAAKVAGFILVNPIAGVALTSFAATVPVLGLLANWTENPKFNTWAIALNKVVQTITFGTSKNQPDVLSWKEMLTNSPKLWPELIDDKITMYM